MSFFVILLSIVNGFLIHSLHGQSTLTPYKLTHQELGQPNTFQLKCTNSIGLAVEDAVFFRNGGLNTTDNCFTGANATSNGVIQLTLASECDGRFMCGTAAEMNEYILSGPTTIYATPIVTSTAVITIQAEEGQDVKVHCPFSTSPLGNYQISLWSNKGGDIQQIPTTSQPATPNALTIANVTMAENTGLHFCQLLDKTNTVYTSPNIKLQIYAKFASPMIISDLSYMVTNPDEGTTLFSIIATGTDINYQWKVNETVYNTTLNHMVVQLPLIGETTVSVRIWNAKYDGTLYEEYQSVLIDRDTHTVIKDSSCQSFSSSTSSGIANIVLLVLLILLFVIMIVGIIALVLIYRRCTIKAKEVPEIPEIPNDNDNQNDSVRLVKFKNISVKIDISKFFDNFPTLFDELDGILTSILTEDTIRNRNPQVDIKIRELKEIIAKFAKEYNQNPPNEDDQVPRGPSNGEDLLKIFLPSLGNLTPDNTYEKIY